ncbi:MAG: hypothetical protein A2008_00065 [Candidatus Wallbacteria bacterium GWC2_49_35]|uniref:Type II secretion system protein GspF domain-containing protein n=1 Tax=Candidatus Wallbacteria bacterium GWC2_49_35 TaxID=1817813 RepID=A0A1F7WWQ1_9BACT|nr:MAG: hypothetical protein A2008_00065 [Candidatus Wallbacteria bacterium GWC2_49_35]HBC74853.1 hypothetical protein [Candidatus Wallbacteria bacterium]
MKYKVSYILKDGEQKTSLVEADDARQAQNAFSGEGFVTGVEKEAGDAAGAAGGFFSFMKHPGDFNLMLFSKELSTLLRAGLTMPEALDTIESHMDNKMLKTAIEGVKNEIIAGSSFSAAVKKRPDVFSGLFARCVEGGETASNLTEVLNILAQNLKNSYQMKSRIINITVYPVMILSITFCVFTFLLLYVIPAFETVFYEIKIDIPPHTAFLFGVSGFLKKYYASLIAGAVLVFTGVFFTGVFSALKKLSLVVMRKLPVSSGLMNNYSLFVFSGMLSAMLRSAAPALESFSTALFALRDITDAPRRDAAMEILKTGGSFSKAVASLGLADGVMARMCAVGERSGKIADMVEMINEYYLENLQNSIERLAEVLEPLIIFLTGIFIAALILSVFLPIIKLTMGGI